MLKTFDVPPLRDMLHLHADTFQMLMDANTVVALRTLAMIGLWQAGEAEGDRMVREKLPVFIEANSAAVHAAMGGEDAHMVASAWLKPIADKTRSNSHRLSRGVL